MTNLIGVEIILRGEAADAAKKLADVMVDDGVKLLEIRRTLKPKQGMTELRGLKGDPHILSLNYELNTDTDRIDNGSGYWDFIPTYRTEIITIRHDGHYTEEQLRRRLKNRSR